MQNSSSFNIDIDSNPSSRVDRTILAHFVREKNLQILQNHGGVGFLSSCLETNFESGISGDNMVIARRRDAFGSHIYSNPSAKPFFHFLFESFKDFTILVLLTCAALSLCFGIKQHGLKEGCYDGASIFAVVSLVIVVSSMTNFMHEQHNKLVDEFSGASKIDVVRNGRRHQIPISEIVVGDVVCLEMGDRVPADGLFLSGHSLKVDESSINEQHPFLFSGSRVVGGKAKMLVTCVGTNKTRFQMMSSTGDKAQNINIKQTPLQARLSELTSFIGKVGLAVAALVVVVLGVRYFAGNTNDKNGNRKFNERETKLDDIVNGIVQILVHAITIVVVTIPMGLPSAVTLTHAHLMKKMMADHQVGMRKLSSCETMGSTTVICTDKTGILTVNHMKVTNFYVGFDEYHSSSSLAPCVVELILEGVALNTADSVFYVLDSSSELEISGSPTDKAIQSWAVRDLNMDMKLITQNCSILQVETFNSNEKRSGVMVRRKADNTIHVHWKGAAEMILKLCSSYFDAFGIVKNLDKDVRSKFEHIIQAMAASGLQCLAFATKQVTEEELLPDEEGSNMIREEGLTLLAITGITNPCRGGVKVAVEACQNAGVRVKMITGDNIFNARNIASECGILELDDQDKYSGTVVEAEEFRNYTHEERSEKIDKICVMARSSPSDKLLMIQCLKQKHHVISVSTGNDTHDAAALNEADIGMSVGKNATKEAKESSDIFIGADNGFVAAVKVLMLLRLVQDSIHKLIVVQLTTNVVALVLNSMTLVVAKHKVPITVVGYFCACLIIYVAYFLSLAVNITGKEVNELIENPPAERINHNVIWRKVLTRAFYLIAALSILQHGFRKSSLFDEEFSDSTATLIFIALMLHRVYNEFHAEKV